MKDFRDSRMGRSRKHYSNYRFYGEKQLPYLFGHGWKEAEILAKEPMMWHIVIKLKPFWVYHGNVLKSDLGFWRQKQDLKKF